MSFIEKKGTREFAEGDIIFSEGDEGSSMFIIQSGEVEVSAIKKKQKVIYARLGKGAIFGEMALIDGHPRSATVTATRPTVCVEMSRMLFNKNLENMPGWMESFFQILAERLREANKKAETLTSQDNSRQVIIMISNILMNIEPNNLDEIITPWKPLVSDIALVLNLPFEQVDSVLNKISLTPMAKSEMSYKDGRIFIMKDFKQLQSFADYCKSRFLEKQGKEIPAHFQKHSPKEQAMLSFMHKIMRAQRWEPDIEQHLFEEQFQEECGKSLSEYRQEMKKFRNMGVIASKLDRNDVKFYIIDKEKLQTMVSMDETLEIFERIDARL